MFDQQKNFRKQNIGYLGLLKTLFESVMNPEQRMLFAVFGYLEKILFKIPLLEISERRTINNNKLFMKKRHKFPIGMLFANLNIYIGPRILL